MSFACALQISVIFSLNLIQITSVVLSSNLEHEVLIFFNNFAGTAFF